MDRKEFITKSAGSLAALTVLNLLKVDGKNLSKKQDSNWTFYRKFQEAKGTQIIIRKFYFTVPKSLEDDQINGITLKVEVYDKGDKEKTSLQTAEYKIAIKKTKAVETKVGYRYFLNCDKYKKQSGPDLLFDSEFENLEKKKSEVKFIMEPETTKMEISKKGQWIMSLDEFDPNADDKDDDCYLTTLCVDHLKKTDNCYELKTLRLFRDEYISKQTNGKHLIDSYYTNAPSVVAYINKSPNKAAILDTMYKDLVQPTLKLIEQNRPQHAAEYYTSYAMALHRFVRHLCC
jgi:hypothetical protein